MTRVSSTSVVAAALVFGLAAPAAAQERIDIERIVSRVHERVRHVLERAGDQRTRDRRDRDTQEQTDRQTRTLKIGADGRLDLSNVSGDITVTAGGRDEATIEIVRRGRGATDADAKRQLELLTIEIIERAGRVEVRARYKEGERRLNASADYTVTAPAGALVTVRSVSGDIRVTGIKGELDVETVSGDVTLDAVGELGRAKTVSGDIDVSGAQVDGTLEASSVSGNVIARSVKARRIELGTVSGDVELTDPTCDAVTAKALSGEISFTGTLAKGGRYAFKSHSGDVRLVLAGDVGFEIEASTFSGTIKSDLPLTIGGRPESAVSRRTIRGVYGDGSALLDVTTFSGSVIIRKR